ncbi:MAG: hypothetical protein OEW87_10595 [Flavobacteriaceae bacterium]|nr:hypothetical protein [Flavobacteriaceae bacterium]
MDKRYILEIVKSQKLRVTVPAEDEMQALGFVLNGLGTVLSESEMEPEIKNVKSIEVKEWKQ